MRKLEKIVRHQSMTTNGVARKPLVVRRVITSEGDKELKSRAVSMITAMTKNSADFKFRRVQKRSITGCNVVVLRRIVQAKPVKVERVSNSVVEEV
jgi:hypothetical protein